MPDTLDPTRLLTLARSRDEKRAYARSLNDRYQSLREQRADVQRRLALARANADASHGGPARAESEAAIKALTAQAEDLSARMTETLAEADAIAAEAQEAGALFRSCLRFAVEKGLTVPPSLAAEAEGLDAPRMYSAFTEVAS